MDKNAEKYLTDLISEYNLHLFSASAVENIGRLMYLKALSDYSIWADHVPDGDKKINQIREEIKQLTKQ